MAKKKNNRKGEIKMTNEEIKNNEPVVTEEVKTTVSNEGEENVVENVNANNEEVENNKPAEETEDKPAEETEEQDEIQPDEIKNASVVNCAKLNVRKEAKKDAEVVCIITKDTELTVSITKSTEDFYKVYTFNNEVLVEGYCVKNYIKID